LFFSLVQKVATRSEEKRVDDGPHGDGCKTPLLEKSKGKKGSDLYETTYIVGKAIEDPHKAFSTVCERVTSKTILAFWLQVQKPYTNNLSSVLVGWN